MGFVLSRIRLHSVLSLFALVTAPSCHAEAQKAANQQTTSAHHSDLITSESYEPSQELKSVTTTPDTALSETSVGGLQYKGRSVAEWCEQFESGSTMNRIQAVEPLAILGPESPLARRALVHGLQSPSSAVSEVCFAALGYIGRPAADELLNGMREAEGLPFLRLCYILKEFDDLPALEDSMLDKACAQMERQQRNGATAIAAFLLNTDTDRDRLSAAVRQLKRSADPSVRRECIRILAAIDSLGEAKAVLFEATDDEDPGVRRECIKLLAAIESPQEAKAVIFEATGDDDPAVRRQAVMELRAFFQPKPDEQAIQLLLDSLTDSDPQVTGIGLRHLTDLNALDRVKEETIINIATNQDNHHAWYASRYALDVLRARGESAKAVVPQLLPMIEGAKLSDIGSSSDHVIETLAGIGASAIDPLIVAAMDPNFAGRLGALRSLQAMGPAADAAVAPLRSLLSHDDPDVCFAAALALASIKGNQATEVIPILIMQLQQAGQRHLAADALVLIGEPILDDLRRELTENRKSEDAVCGVLSRLGAPAVPILIDAITNRNASGSAVKALGTIGADAKAAVPLLVARLAGEYSRVDAAEALARIGPDAKDAAGELREGLNSGNGMYRATCAVALIKIAATNEDVQRGTDYINSMLIDETAQSMDRYSAYLVMSQHDLDADVFLPALIESLKGELAPYVASSLTDRKAITIPALTQALHSPNERVVARAASCLGKMGPESLKSLGQMEAAWQRVQSDAAKKEIRLAAWRLDSDSRLGRIQTRENQLVELKTMIHRKMGR